MPQRTRETIREAHARIVNHHREQEALGDAGFQRILNHDNTLAIHVAKETEIEKAARAADAAAAFEHTFGRPMRDDDPTFWDADFTDQPRPTPERELADAQAVSLGNAALRSGDPSLAVQTLTIRTCGGLILTDENLHQHPVEQVEEWFAVRDAIQERVGRDGELLRTVTEYVYTADILKSAIHRYAKHPTPERVALLKAAYRQLVSDFGPQGTIYANNMLYAWLFLYYTAGPRGNLTEAAAEAATKAGPVEAARIEDTWAMLTPAGEFGGNPPRDGHDTVAGMLLLGELLHQINPEQDNSLENALNTGDVLDVAFTLAETHT